MNYRRRFPALLLVLILALSAVLVSCRTSGGGTRTPGAEIILDKKAMGNIIPPLR